MGRGARLMGARRWPHCVGLSLALIIVIKFLGGGYVQQALVRLSIGNSPLCPEDKSTHSPFLSWLATVWTGHQTSNLLNWGLLAYYKKGYLNCMVYFIYVLSSQTLTSFVPLSSSHPSQHAEG